MVLAALSVSHPPEHQPVTLTTLMLAAQLPLPLVQQVSLKPLGSVIAWEPGALQLVCQIRQKKGIWYFHGSLIYNVTHDCFMIWQDESTV